jgi:uncharacterized repeat protein (TIGR02059 family)
MKSFFRHFINKKQIKYLFACITLMVICSFGIFTNIFAGNDDGIPPVLNSFTSSASNGSYGAGADINITANFDEELDPASTMIVVLDTGASINLTSPGGLGQTLSGTYTVGSGENSSDLTVSSISSANVTDTDSNGMGPNTQNSFSVPGGNSLGDNSNIVVDTTIPNIIPVVSLDRDNLNLYINYDQILDTASVPDSSDFSVTVNGMPNLVSAVSISAYKVTITLTDPVATDDEVKIGYTSTANPIKSTFGNLASNFNDQAVVLYQSSCRDIVVGGAPAYQTLVGTKLYVNNITDDTVSVIDTITDTLEGTIIVSSGPYTSYPIGHKLYVGNVASGNISVINTDMNQVITTISTGAPSNATYFTFTSIGNKLYVNNFGLNKIYVVDTSIDQVTSTLNFSGSVYYSVIVGNKLFVPNGNNLNVVDTTTDTVIATSTLSTSNGLAAYYSNGKVYVNNSGVVDVFNATNYSYIKNFVLGGNPFFSIVDGTKIYVINNSGYSKVSVIDTVSDTITKTINTLGENSYGGTLVGTKLYVQNSTSQTVSIIDTTIDSIVAILPVGSNAQFSAASTNKKLYINNSNSDSVSVIDITTNTLYNTCSPHILTLTSSDSGNKTTGDNITLTATFNKALASNSKMRLTLNTGRTVDLYSIRKYTLRNIHSTIR